jgi:uncharacterized protein YjbI with pentapeptide repeats
MCAKQTTEQPDPVRPVPRFRLVRVLVIGVSVGGALGFAIGLFLFVQRPEFQQIRGAWLAERPFAQQLQNYGARFNEVIWWTPENGESFLFASAYKHYRQVQHIRFTNPDVSKIPFSRLKEFEHLDSIDLSDTNVRADQLAEMRNKQWVMIDLCRTTLTAECLSNLVTTNRLTYLSLAASSVKDEMLAPLTNATIGVLSLDDTKITDVGMATVAQMRSVHSLSLSGTKLGDEGLRALSQSKFTDLNLRGTAITDAGLTDLLVSSPGRRLTLNLSNTRISDAGMSTFKRLTYVDELNLANTQISDVGLENLKEQRYLRWLCVGGTKATSVGVQSLLKNREKQKAVWKTQGPRRSVEPPDLVIIVDQGQTERPRAYPQSRY